MTKNDEAPGQGRPDTAHLSPQLIGSTRLQAYLCVTFAVLDDARDELSDDQYRALVEILCDRLGLEAARFVLGEALRATRDEVT